MGLGIRQRLCYCTLLHQLCSDLAGGVLLLRQSMKYSVPTDTFIVIYALEMLQPHMLFTAFTLCRNSMCNAFFFFFLSCK